MGFKPGFILASDFNLNSAGSPTCASELLGDIGNTFSLLQRSAVVNSYGSQLDLVFSDLSTNTAHSPNPIVKEDLYHPALDVDLILPVSNLPHQYKLVPNFSNFDIFKLRDELPFLIL